MKSEALKYFTDTPWTAFALLLFFGFFSVLIYRVYFSRTTQQLENLKFQLFPSGEENERN